MVWKERDVIFYSYISYRYAEGFLLLPVQNSSWQGTSLFGSCIKKKQILEGEDRLSPSAVTSGRAPLVIPQGPPGVCNPNEK